MDEAGGRLRAIVQRADQQGVRACQLRAAGRLLARTRRHRRCGCRHGAIAVALLCGVAALLVTVHLQSRGWPRHHMCKISLPDKLMPLFRRPEDCSMCRGLSQVDKVANITPNIFEERYAYTGRPVVVTDAMKNWTAWKVFNFKFFKNVYEDHWHTQMGCQFFPYETEFQNLYEVFNMSLNRAYMHDGTEPWYIGWSNCDHQVARILRRHYSRPYFLPVTSENKKLDWIFMGSPGYGAHLHVDDVEYPSWQAQLKGMKKWILVPPPECYYDCQRLEVTVEAGEISNYNNQSIICVSR